MDERPDGEGSTPPRPPEAPPAWSPPDAGAPPPPPPAPTGSFRFEPDAEGPPTPPPVRARRRRWIVAGVIAAVVLVVGVPVGLAVAGWSAFTTDDGGTDLASDDGEDATTEQTPDDPDATPDADDPDAGPDGDPDTGGPDGDPDPDGGAAEDDQTAQTLDPLDLDDLDGVDATYGQLLTDIDASERVMMTFQDEIGTVFTSPGEDPEALMARVQEVAGDQRAQLLEVRDRMDDEVADDGAETVRERYVAHLDAWADYMAAVEETPQALAGEGDDAAFNLAINTSADAFARSLEDELPDDVDEEVRRFAEAILERGFRGAGAADV